MPQFPRRQVDPRQSSPLLLRKHMLILVVRPDPKPEVSIVFKQSECSVTLPDPDRPRLTDLLETQGRMADYFAKGDTRHGPYA